MSKHRWRVLVCMAAVSALCWGTAGAVHLGFEYSGGPNGGYGLPEGGGWYELAFILGLIVSFYAYSGGGFARPLFREKWWHSLSLTIGTAVGAVSVLELGQGQRYWVAAAIMAAIGAGGPLVNILVERHQPRRPRPRMPA
ncbi:hypothetical protein [Actinomadura sp. 6N118]|uniref:hypothetical protein n=1 Tax=Actinomadura sp. 6N118 TaxID=3375151 RepID=UPI0037A24835